MNDKKNLTFTNLLYFLINVIRNVFLHFITSMVRLVVWWGRIHWPCT